MKHQSEHPTNEFSKIKPYEDDQVHFALVRILSNPVFQQIIDYLFPKETHAKLREDLLAAKSSLEFQKIFMYTGLKSVLEKTSPKGLHFQNENYIKDGRPITYIANHRDILLDSALLQLILVDLSLETSEITFGSNLIVNDFINDLGRINRMFTVYREGSVREILQNAKDLSAYINYTLHEKKRSIWIAQRKGRTKNGIDKTDPGIIKMLISSSKQKVNEAVRNLDIVPLSISYEWEPCDATKVRELYTKQFGTYKKFPGEDIQSVVNGIIGYKGGIHLNFCNPLNLALETFDKSKGNRHFLNEVTEYIDKQIIKNYKLWPSNYYAFDLANQSNDFKNNYNNETINIFHERIEQTLDLINGDREEVKQIFIDIYANPIRAKKDLGFEIT